MEILQLTIFLRFDVFYHIIPVFHVETGLRTYDLFSIIPEEYNRKSIDL